MTEQETNKIAGMIEILREDIRDVRKDNQSLRADMDKRMDSMEKRMDGVVERMDGLEKRVDKRMDSMQSEIKELKIQADTNADKNNTHFRALYWAVGTLIAFNLGAILTAVNFFITFSK